MQVFSPCRPPLCDSGVRLQRQPEGVPPIPQAARHGVLLRHHPGLRRAAYFQRSGVLHLSGGTGHGVLSITEGKDAHRHTERSHNSPLLADLSSHSIWWIVSRRVLRASLWEYCPKNTSLTPCPIPELSLNPRQKPLCVEELQGFHNGGTAMLGQTQPHAPSHCWNVTECTVSHAQTHTHVHACTCALMHRNNLDHICAEVCEESFLTQTCWCSHRGVMLVLPLCRRFLDDYTHHKHLNTTLNEVYTCF